MGDRPLTIVPVKSFAGAKTRLAPRLDEARRARLGAALASRTAWAARDAGSDVVIVAGTPEVMAWADRSGFPATIQPPDAGGLDGAAAIGITIAANNDRRGFILHADLPWVTAPVLRSIFAADGVVIAPSHDGGTALLGGITPGFPFAYGPASFHRHLASSPGAIIATRPLLALDLDQPADLDRALAAPAGRWMRRYVA